MAKDARIGEKAAAWAVSNAMKMKSKFGMGVTKKKKRSGLPLKKIVSAAKKSIIPGKDAHSVIKSALQGARTAVREAGGKRNVKKPRILPVPRKVGGFLPFLLPIFAGLSATEGLAGGAARIAKAVNDAKQEFYQY